MGTRDTSGKQHYPWVWEFTTRVSMYDPHLQAIKDDGYPKSVTTTALFQGTQKHMFELYLVNKVTSTVSINID